MKKGSGLIENTLLRSDLSFSDSDNLFKNQINGNLTLERVRTFLVLMKKVVELPVVKSMN